MCVVVCLSLQSTQWYRMLDESGGKGCMFQYLQLSFRWGYRSVPFTGHVPEYKCVASRRCRGVECVHVVCVCT